MSLSFNELLIFGYLRNEILQTFYIPVVLIQLITNNVFQQPAHKTKMKPVAFQWGQYHSYWDEKDFYYLQPIHKNLKQELFNNSIFKLTVNQWRQVLRTCTVFSKSFACNRIRAQNRPKWNRLLNISCGTTIDIKHIIVLKIYSDYDPLTYHFTQVLQGHDRELKRQIAHFTRLIMEAVHLYGVHWSAAARDMKLYHGVNNNMYANMLLDTSYTTPYFPLTATSSFHVAKTFATENGSVLQFNRADTKGPIVLNLSPITSYPEEVPWIVMNDMFAIDAVYGNKGDKCEMKQMQFVQKLLNGSYLVDRDGKPLKNVVDSMKMFTEMLIYYMYTTLWCISEIRSEAQNMFNMFMDSKRFIFINDAQLLKMNKICDIFIRYNYKLISIPTLTWLICDNEYEELVNGNRILESKEIKADISHLVTDGRDHEVIFKANCTVNEKGGFEFELNIVAKPDGIKHVEYEYELLLPNLCYRICTLSNSHCTQCDILQTDVLQKHHASLEINVAIRILKCFDF